MLRGWARVGVLLVTMFTAILRPSEILLARRRHLVLPRDINYDADYALLVIPEPKNRRWSTTPARQSAKIQPKDLVDALDQIYGDELPEAPLWPASSDAFRKRFRTLNAFFGLPEQVKGAFSRKLKVLQVASMRAGGATLLWLQTEDARLVQLRGRWQNDATMTIYLQELVATTFLSEQPESTRATIALYDRQAPLIWHQTLRWMRQGVPPERIPESWRSEILRHR